ncbi:MAG: hypothetical protein DDT28_00586 [Dehalococcoidia bacterium]|nr:hypothetical protein [Chloroflexota bacterium]
MRAEGSAAAGAMWSHFIPLIDEAFVPQLLYQPPAGLDVVVIQGYVGMIQVDPEADALGQLFPFLNVL